MQEFIPRSDIERAYAQACCWNRKRVWSRATRNLYRDRTAIATAMYLAMAKTTMEDGDYTSAVTTIRAVEEYSPWLTPADKILLVRVLCDILASISENSEPEVDELKKVTVMVASHFMADFGSERMSVLNSMTELRRTGAVDMISELAVRGQTRQLHADFQLSKHFCDKIINEIGKRERFIQSLDKCIMKLVTQINKSPDSYHLVVIGMVSECQLCLELMSERIDDKTIKQCKTRIQNCLLALSKKLGTDKNNQTDSGQILNAELPDINAMFKAVPGLYAAYRPTIADEPSHYAAYRRTIAEEHEPLKAVRYGDVPMTKKNDFVVAPKRHLITLLSLCAICKQSSTTATIIQNFLEVIGRDRVSGAYPLLNFCTEQLPLCDWIKGHVRNNPEISLTNLILLAGENFSLKQDDLGLFLLTHMLDSFPNTTVNLGFIGTLWQNSVTRLLPYWRFVYAKFIVPLVALTELHLGNQVGLIPVYQSVLKSIRSAFGEHEEQSLLKHIIVVREKLQGKGSTSLLPLLRLLAASADTLNDEALCIESGKSIMQILEARIQSTGVINIHYLTNFLFVAKYQMKYSSPSLENTLNLLEKCFETCVKNQTVTSDLIFLLCNFTLKRGARIERGMPGSVGDAHPTPSENVGMVTSDPDVGISKRIFALLENMGEAALSCVFENDEKLSQPPIQEKSLEVLFKLSQANSWQLHHKFVPLLTTQASYYLSEKAYDKATSLYELIVSAQSKTAQFAQAFLLARNAKLDEATEIMERALAPPFPSLEREELSQLSFLIKECIQNEKLDAAARIAAILLPTQVSNDAQTHTERAGGLIYSLVMDGDLATAEFLLANLNQRCQSRESVTFQLIVLYLGVPSRFPTFINLLWQPNVQKTIYPSLMELKRQIMAGQRARFQRPDV